MPLFDRSIVPRETTAPRSNAAPLQSPALNSKRQVRETLAAGFTWTEEWPPIDVNTAGVRGFLAELDAWFRQGAVVQVRPFHWGEAAMGTIAAGTVGAVNGGGQTGSTLNTNGWPAGTVEKGDYVKVEGLGYAQKIMADATVSGGALVLTLDPPIWAGSSPADAADVTLNGLLDCYIIDFTSPRVEAREKAYYRGLSVTFAETR